MTYNHKLNCMKTRNKNAFRILTTICIVSLLGISLSTGKVYAQKPDTLKTRPKIGLVLSGGGAKGFAHVGVLKVLEEVGIKPDIITGTSMGSIIGSLYAVGYTADEIALFARETDWNYLLTDNEKLTKVAMDEKNETNKYIFKLLIEEKKIDLPSGMIEGQHLENKFSELFWPLTEQQRFDSLPIPFHCMAVDVVSGKRVELKSGDLAQAIRSSMAIPTVFAPVRKDSMLLVDGGVARNFPVQEAIDMGADIIIGVYVGFPEDVTADDLKSMSSVLARSVVLAGVVDAREQYKKVDILILPNLGKYGSGDFTSGEIIEKMGEKAAWANYDELKALADSLKLSYKKVPAIKKPEKIRISEIKVENLKNMSADYVKSKSGIQKGDSVSVQEILDAIEYIHGSPYFSKLTYSLKKDENDEDYILIFHVKENPRVVFQFTPNYTNDFGVGLVANVTLRNVIRPSTRILLTLNISKNPEFKIDMNRLLGKKQHFTSHFFFNGLDYKLPLYSSGEEIGHYKMRTVKGGYGVRYSPGLCHQLGCDGFYKHNMLKPEMDLRLIFEEAGFGKYISDEWGYSAYYKVNTTDDLYFPKKGMIFNVYFTHYLNSKAVMRNKMYGDDFEYFINERSGAYVTLTCENKWYKTFWDRATCHLGFNVGVNMDESEEAGYFVLGSDYLRENEEHTNFSGFNYAEIFASNFFVAKSGFDFKVLNNLYLSGNANVGNFCDTSSDLWEELRHKSFKDYYWGFSAGIKYNSIIGPIQFLVADNNKDSKTRFQLSVGFPF